MVKPGYKQTEIGVIPEDWEIKKLKYVAPLQRGFDLPYSNMKEGKYPVVFSNGIGAYHSCYMVKSPGVVTGRSGTIGKVHFVDVNFWPHNTSLWVTNFFGNDELFIYYLFNTINWNLYNSGSGVPTLNRNDVHEIILTLPPLPEQKRIAEALSDVDSMISSLEKLIAKKKAVKQGTMQELLSGKKRLDGFSEEWNNYRIGDMGDFYSGLSGKSKKDFDCGKARFITFLNVLSNIMIDTSILARVNVKANESQNAVQKGDLFFNTSSETPEEVGMCAVLDEDLKDTYLNSFCFGFRLLDNTHNPLFLSYYLNSSIGRKIMGTLAQGATRYNLSKNNFADTIVLLPSKEEQTAIASILSDMDKEIEALEQKLAKIRQVKQGMMQQLLTGKIRLVAEEKATAAISATEQTDLPHSKSKHNQQFGDAVMIAAIVNAFYSKYPLGRKKVQKLLYLLRRKQQEDISAFKKKTAGPYADEVRYKGGEPIARKQGYITTTTTQKGTAFARGKAIDVALSYIDKWQMQSDIDWLVSTFKYTKTNDLELYATIDMAICDLQHEDMSVSVDSVKDLIRSNKEWKAKLTKTYFSDADIARAIDMCKRLYS